MTFIFGARGEYPIHLGHIEDFDLPGLHRSGRATIDAAEVIAKERGIPLRLPNPDAVVYPDLTKYLEKGYKDKLRWYQKQDALWLAQRAYAIHRGAMRCLSGDSEIIINRAGCVRRIQLSELVRKLEGGETKKQKWRKDVKTQTQSLNHDGTIGLNTIIGWHRTGIREAIRIETESGRAITCSLDHKIRVPDGWAEARYVRPGSVLMHAFRPKLVGPSEPKKNLDRVVEGMWCHPYCRVYNRRKVGTRKVAQVLKHRLALEAKINGLELNEFVRRIRENDELESLAFLDPSLFAVHHINGDHTDNSPENLEALSRVEHSRKHATDGAWRHVQYKEHPDRVVRVERVEDQEMFDLTLDGDRPSYVANGLIVHNSGKSRTVTAAATLISARRVLIVGPAIARAGWAREIKTCEDQDLLILYGRSGTEARYRGKKVKDVRSLLVSCRWVYANYEILQAQHERDGTGKLIERADLPGWTEILAEQDWDLGVLDESQNIRGISQGFKRRRTRADCVRHILRKVPRVWATTGTPMMGRARDLWNQLDVISGGLWGKNQFGFDVRYCSGGHTGYRGAWAIGEDIRQDELKDRLRWFVRSRKRAEILPHLPAKTREVVRIEPDEPVKQIARGDSESKATRQLRAVLKLKIPHVVSNIQGELEEGSKVLVLCERKESCEDVFAAFNKLGKGLPNFKAWLGDGRITVDARVAMGERFREHVGCGVFVSNIAALSGGISLYSTVEHHPSTSVHFVEWGYVPEAMAQAEDRMNDPENRFRGLSIVHYTVQGSIDEHIETIILPKVESIANVLGSESSESMRDALRTPKALLEAAWLSYSQTLNLNDIEDD